MRLLWLVILLLPLAAAQNGTNETMAPENEADQVPDGNETMVPGNDSMAPGNDTASPGDSPGTAGREAWLNGWGLLTVNVLAIVALLVVFVYFARR